MSQRIDDVLNVLREIRNQYAGDHGINSVRKLRIAATAQVAARRYVGRNDINDALGRRLLLKSVPRDFDPLVERWLSGDASKLRAALERAVLDNFDLHSVTDFLKQPVVQSPSKPTTRKPRRRTRKR